MAGRNTSDPTQIIQELFFSAELAAEEEAGVLHDSTTLYNSDEFGDYSFLAKISKCLLQDAIDPLE